jgi:hypothetical protein
MFEDFGNRKKIIEELSAEKAALQQRVADLEGDPYVAIGQEIKADVTALIAQGAGNAALSAAIAEHRDRARQERINEVAQEDIRAELAAQKTLLLEAEEVAVAKLVQLAVQRFMLEEADDYRESVRAKLAKERPAAAIREAKQQIEAEEKERLVETHKQRLLEDKASQDKREELRLRAKELRTEGKKTHLLHLNQLEDGDQLTITFCQKGQGFEELTNYGDYRSTIERRKITGSIIDKDAGLFEIEKDSWFKDSRNSHLALRGGQQVVLRAPDHIAQSAGRVGQEELSSCIAKGAPLTILNRQNEDLRTTPDLDVWWVNLGDFKALS